ncbi:MAG: hypothetical protein AB1714_21195 [Acidobacteriota bacterium]
MVQALDNARLEYAVVGGLAVAIWGAPRATTHIDLLVSPADIDAISGIARSLGFLVEALPMRFADGVELRRFSRIESEYLLTLDLLLLSPNLQEAWESRQRILTEAGPVTVVSRDALIRMKALAGRPQDLADIARLTELDR